MSNAKKMIFVILLAAITAIGVSTWVLPKLDPLFSLILPIPPVPQVFPPPHIHIVEHVTITAYCSCRICTGKWSRYGRTTSGRNARTTTGFGVAQRAIPLGTKLYAPGIGIRQADDGCGACRTDFSKNGLVHLDLRMRTHREAQKFGIIRDTFVLVFH